MMPEWLAMTRMCGVVQTQPGSECPGRGGRDLTALKPSRPEVGG